MVRGLGFVGVSHQVLILRASYEVGQVAVVFESYGLGGDAGLALGEVAGARSA